VCCIVKFSMRESAPDSFLPKACERTSFAK
jgi:hypothetical protein